MRRPPRLKKFRSRVRPGVLEVRARVLRPVNAFSRLDLPTLDRPAKATSVPPPSCGRSFSSAAETRKSQGPAKRSRPASRRSEEHTSELQSLMRISYAVFCLKKKRTQRTDPKRRPETWM